MSLNRRHFLAVAGSAVTGLAVAFQHPDWRGGSTWISIKARRHAAPSSIDARARR
ncbi:hypothetical protein [Bradyrhizobium icense]|uniref:hypothetical protein n=1 Tax=Bradyrhizobium icense TaxID=1274631 RepID=UPI0012E9A0EF|nr:hypothetical protein [Bradyrhizobium icense]